MIKLDSDHKGTQKMKGNIVGNKDGASMGVASITLCSRHRRGLSNNPNETMLKLERAVRPNVGRCFGRLSDGKLCKLKCHV